jgi:hypothetical protein
VEEAEQSRSEGTVGGEREEEEEEEKKEEGEAHRWALDRVAAIAFEGRAQRGGPGSVGPLKLWREAEVVPLDVHAA